MADIFVGGVLAALFGVAIAALNYIISKRLLSKSANYFSVITLLRQALNIAYLVALYFLSKLLMWPVEALLIGGALGVTVPSFIFAVRLSRDIMNNSAQSAEKKNDAENLAGNSETE